MRLNLGCGAQVVEGWINVDYAPGARLAKLPLFRRLNRRIGLFRVDWDERIHLHDLTRRFPWQPGSAEAVYSSHTLEHLTRDAGRAFLAECHRVLRPGGIIRVLVPDLRHEVREYIEGRVLADRFVEQLGVLYIEGESRLRNRLSPFIQFPHKCMYDAPTLLRVLRETGFDATTRGPFESEIDDIRRIEIADRTDHAVVVEGRKR